MSATINPGYIKSIPLGEFQTWVEREFEAVERGIFNATQTPRWDDLRFPANGIDPAGLTNPATRSADLTKFPGSLEFAGNALNVIAGVAQMPHQWRNGSEIHPHIHWTVDTASAAAVDWEFYYRMVGNVGDTAGGWNGPFNGTIQVGSTSIPGSHILSSFDAIDMTGYQDSCMLVWYIRRLGNTDANNNVAYLLEFDIHYQTDIAGGSISEYPSTSPFAPVIPAGSLVIAGNAPTITKT